MCDADPDELRGKLARFYDQHSPGKDVDLDAVLKLVTETQMDEYQLFTSLCRKYGIPYDPLEWKEPVIGKGTVGGAGVSRMGVNNAGKTEAPRPNFHMDVPSPHASSSKLSAGSVSPSTSPRAAGTPLQACESSADVDDDDGPMSPTGRHMQGRRKKLEEFYKRYNPVKLSDVDRIMDLASDSTEEQIFESLCKKYNLPMRDVFEKIGVDSDRFANRALRDTRRSKGSRSDLRGQLRDAEGRDKGEAVLRAEFAEWITNTLRLRPALTADNVFENLRDGVILCRLIDVLDPKSKIRFNAKPPNHFQKLANVEAFLQCCVDNFGIEKDELFDPQDLVDGAQEQEQRAIMTLFLSLAKVAHTKFSSQAPQIVKLELEIEEDDAKNEVTNEDLERMLLERKRKADLEEQARKEQELREAQEKRRQEREEAERRRKEQEYERLRAEKLEAMRRAAAQKRHEEERRLAAERKRMEEEEERRRREERAAERRRKEEDKLRRERERQRLKDMEARRQRSSEAEDNPVFQYKNKQYVADKRDAVDMEVGRVMNSLPKQAVATQMYKLQGGMYVIEYPKRIVFYVRVCRDTAMIRVGGGWQSLEEFLMQRLRMYPEEQAKYIPINESHGADRVTLLHQNAQRMRYQM